jgi:hypothetical protein
MIDSAMKTIKSRVYRVGIGVIAPAIQDIVDWVMDEWDEEFVKVDAEVYVRGLEGIVTKSLVIGKIQELLQYLAPFVQSGTVDPAVISSLVNRFMLEAGMDNMDFHKSQLEIGSALGQVQSTPVTASQGQQANG